MKEIPIIFNGAMVRAILSGAKNQTRRLVKPQPDLTPEWNNEDSIAEFYIADECVYKSTCPFGKPGNMLWVREAIRHIGDGVSIYAADDEYTVADAWPWKRNYLPPMHCPRGLSRITLEITSVRVERLKDISEADAIAEGVERRIIGEGWREYGLDAETEAAGTAPLDTAIDSYRSLWGSLYGQGSWEANPLVWAISFQRL